MDDSHYRNPKPVEMRGKFPIFACYTCLTRKRNPTISKKWNYPCLTKRWEKVIYSTTTRQYYLKQHYMVNRETYFRIFEHDRIAAYPTGIRFFQSDNRNENEDEDDNNSTNYGNGESLTPVVSCTNFTVAFKDRFEIMSSGIMREHGTGNIIGPLINIKNLRELFQFVKSNPSVDINTNVDTFINTMIPSPPNSQSYADFIIPFEKNRNNAVKHYIKCRKKRRQQEYLAQLRKIQNIIDAICGIVHCVDIQFIKKVYLDINSDWSEFNHDTLKLNVNIIRRMLLCYREENLPHQLHYTVSYDTGWCDLNRRLEHLLRKLLKAPLTFTKSRTQTGWIAFEVVRGVIMIWGPAHLWSIPAIAHNKIVKEGFTRIYRPMHNPHYWAFWKGWEAKKWTQYGRHAPKERRLL